VKEMGIELLPKERTYERPRCSLFQHAAKRAMRTKSHLLATLIMLHSVATHYG